MQTYTVEIADGHGGTDSQLVTITINGTNDAAVITGDSIGAVVEAGGVDNDIPGTPTDSGDLDSTDVDDADDAWTAVGSQTASANGYGTFTITGAGVWTYTLDNTNAAVQGIPAGGTLADSFTVATTDGTSQVVSITITGANDAPVAVDDGNAGDAVTESGVAAGDPSAAGNVLTNDIDVDTGDTKTVTVVNGSALNVGQPLVGTYGTLTLLADGSWTYALNNADPDTDALVQGQAVTDVFTYTMADANGATSSAALTITITGGQRCAGGGGRQQRRRCGDRERGQPWRHAVCGRSVGNRQRADQRHRRRHGDSRTVTAVNGSAPNVGAPLVGIYGTLTLAGRRQLDLCAQQRRSRHQRAGAGPGRQRRLYLHRDRRQRWQLDRGADHHHHRHQRCAGGGGRRQRRRCGDRERGRGRRPVGGRQRADQRHRRRHWRHQDRDRGQRRGRQRRRSRWSASTAR